MVSEFQQIEVDGQLEDDFRQLVRLAVREDFASSLDWTTVSLVPDTKKGRCRVVSRENGIACGVVLVDWLKDEMGLDVEYSVQIEDGQAIVPGQCLLQIEGSARDILSSERILLNTLCRLCGIASQTKQYVDALSDLQTGVYDTRKTTLGWRRLDKYGVRCGGGRNHRTGLFDAFLIKDNHLALGGGQQGITITQAIEKAQQWAGSQVGELEAPEMLEIEVDTLAQFAEALPLGPNIVLLDNFELEELREAVRLRDASGGHVQLEASGNVTLQTIREIALCGVDRISSGALTHAARWLDLGLDWSGE